MGRLIYSAIGSVDGYTADSEGNFDWAEPDEEVLNFLNALEGSIGTHLYGRRMYEMMAVWENDLSAAALSEESAVFAENWKLAEKFVYSTTLAEVSTRQTTLLRTFDADHVRRLKATRDKDIYVSGPDLASHAFRAGVVDEFQVITTPVVIGSGKTLHPGTRVGLDLKEVRRFGNGMVWTRYDVV